MDPLTHVVVGRFVVAAAGRGEESGGAVSAAAILGALSPDIDSALAFTDWGRYLRAHQSGTHSILGALTLACLTAVVVRLGFVRSRSATLFAAATAGAMSHIALDLASGARIAIGWPLVDRRVSLPLVAMADPWLIGISLAGLLALWPFRARTRIAARFVLVTMMLFLGFKAAMLAFAIRGAHLDSDGPSAFDARWGSLTEWSVFERTAGTVRSSALTSKGGPPVVVMSQPLGSASPRVEASRAFESVQDFLAVHDFAFPTEHREDDERISVLWSDLRYCWPEPARAAIGCGVWVGGVFDRNGRAVRQEIKVGRLVQTRPLRR